MTAAIRNTTTTETTTVRYVAKPFGSDQENPPSLADLRTFLEACDGLPGDLRVRFEQGNLDAGGRWLLTLSVTHRVAVEAGGSP